MIFKENSIKKLYEVLSKHKKEEKVIVWTNWCFDLLHPWHIETFKKAKELWDILVVWLNGKDSPYWSTKPWRPINDENFRSIMIDSLKYVDYVYIFNDETPRETVSFLKPDIVLKGWDYIQKSIKEKVFENSWLFDLTEAYKFILLSNNQEFFKEKWFMPEWLENVKNWWKVFVVNTFWNYSTTNIIYKIEQYLWKKF